MDLVPVRMSAGTEARTVSLPPEVLADVLWAVALAADRLEHIRARHGPSPRSVDVVLFLLPAEPESTADVALRLCRRAVDTAPSLIGWTVEMLGSIQTP
ncbi:hypothetical protein ABIA35_004301 [Catenulispora sp. MAP12-49]|jgi:hypothetical protein|uniref:hypothetical protein n=1 Tax=unclassified Catenulispora TaxID=414885 RepID=UPI003516C906